MIKRITLPILGIILTSFLAWALVPMPGPARAQFVDQSTYGGTSVGSANSQSFTIANYTSHTPGVVLRFVPGFTNTGNAAVCVSSLSCVTVVRPSSIGNTTLSGGELTAGELTCVTYNGTAYQLSCNVDMTPIGRTIEFRGSSTPRGALIEDGSCVSRTTYAPLFTVIGTTYNACDGSTTFGVPDSRGTTFASLDNQGANGAANRITTAASGCNGTVIGICGNQTATVSQTYLPNVPLTASVNGTLNGTASVTSANNDIMRGAVTFANFSYQGGGTAAGALLAANSVTPGFQGSSGTSSVSGTLLGGTSVLGSGVAMPILPPLSLGRRAIKF